MEKEVKMTSLQPNNVIGALVAPEFNELPDIRFRDDAGSFTSAVNAIGDAIELRTTATIKNENIDQFVSTIVNQTAIKYEALKQDASYAYAFEPIVQLAGSLSEKVQSVFNVLRYTVKPEMDNLKDAIRSRTEINLKANNMPVFTSAPDITANFRTFEWAPLLSAVGGVGELPEIFKSITGVEPSDSIADLGVAMNCGKLEIKQLDINADTKKDIIERLTNSDVYRIAVSGSSVEHIYDLFTDVWTYNNTLKNVIWKAYSTNDTCDTVLKCENAIKLMEVIYEVKKVPLDVSAELLDSIQSNLDAIIATIQIAGYALLKAENMYKDNHAILMGETLINGDLVDEMTTSGITLEDIYKHHYILVKVPEAIIPATGISLETISDHREQVNQKYDEIVNGLQVQFEFIRHDYTVRAMQEVLREYLENTDATRLPEGVNIDNFVTTKAQYIQVATGCLGTNADDNLEAVLYDFIINVHFNNSITKTAHKLLGSELIKQMNAKSDLNEVDFIKVSATVATKIIAQFLANEIVCPAMN